jgi:hypothetical protein
VVSVNRSERIRLTKVQARALANWWGGHYKQMMSPGNSGEVWHGVVFRQLDRKDHPMSLSQEIVVFSLEEARALENFRDAVNPGSPDWVG